jgi:hypothetical protein
MKKNGDILMLYIELFHQMQILSTCRLRYTSRKSPDHIPSKSTNVNNRI